MGQAKHPPRRFCLGRDNLGATALLASPLKKMDQGCDAGAIQHRCIGEIDHKMERPLSPVAFELLTKGGDGEGIQSISRGQDNGARIGLANVGLYGFSPLGGAALAWFDLEDGGDGVQIGYRVGIR